MKASLFYKASCQLGESPIWDEKQQLLYWIDIEQKALHSINTKAKKHQKWIFDHPIGAICQDQKGQIIMGLEGYVARFDPITGTLEKLQKIDEPADNRSNDGKCDPGGRFWLGTHNKKGITGKAALYCMYPDFSIHKKIPSVTTSNGLAWTKDKKTLYFIYTPTRSVQQFRYNNATAAIHFIKKAIEIPACMGFPDGMTIDENNHLWIAHYGGSGVYCRDPTTGKIIEKVETPVPNVTSCTFGGIDMKTLFITTARNKMSRTEDKRYPLSGSIFCVETGVKGCSSFRFKG